ncbi:MAG: hypothetical protein JWQ19_2588 [Subtercola sp.]|nr:hypothetical protein [Subtercola sp.]
MNAIGYAVEVTHLWFEAGIPNRLVWRGQRWRVSDTPTELDELMAMLTHPPALVGWRFQATNHVGDSRVFDVVQGDAETWVVAKVYG